MRPRWPDLHNLLAFDAASPLASIGRRRHSVAIKSNDSKQRKEYDHMSTLTIGAPAPDFALSNQQGEMVSLSQLRGKTVVLWWYPKADTPG